MKQASEDDDKNAPHQIVSKVPDGGWGWVVTGATFINANIIGGVIFTFGAFLPALIETFDQTPFVLCWILALQQSVSMVVGPLVSFLCHRFSYRTVMIMGGVISALGMLSSAFVNHIAFLFLTMGLTVGIGEGFINLPGVIMVSLYFNRKRPLATGIALSGYGSGVILYGLLVPYLVEEYTWRGTCVFMAGMFLQCCVCGCLVRPPSMEVEDVLVAATDTHPTDKTPAMAPLLVSNHSIKTFRSLNPAFDPSKEAHFCLSSVIDLRSTANPQQASIFLGSHSTVFNLPLDEHDPSSSCLHLFCDVELLKNVPLILFYISNFCINLAFMPPFTFILERCTQTGFTALEVNLFLSLLGLFCWLGRLAFAVVGSIHGVDRRFLLLLSLLGMGVPCLLMPFCKNTAWMLLFVVTFGVASGKYCTLQAVVVCDLVDSVDQVPSTLAMMTMIIGWATLLANPIAGAIYDLTKMPDAIYIFCGGLFMVAAVVWLPVTLQKCYRTTRQAANEETAAVS